MSGKHTPGQYSIQDCREFIQQEQKFLVLGPTKPETGGKPVLATVLIGNVPPGQAKANAYLFAASTDLLSEAKLVLGYWDKEFRKLRHEDGPFREQMGIWMGRLSCAIAKAEGR